MAVLPGVSPHGYVYRLSKVFDQYPAAKVGVTQLDLSVLGYHKYKLNCDIEARHLPVLHYFVPQMEFFTRKSHLSMPVTDAYDVLYKNQGRNRWTYLVSRFAVCLGVAICMGAGLL